jgi:glycosyltransferase involved in cell wall biosynthesis
MRDAPTLTICIPTFRRPKSLKRLLDAIAALETRAALRILVADNDAKVHAGFDLAQAMAPRFPWPLQAVIAPQRGLAQVRNTLIAHALQARPDFIAMIDDDEWPAPGWIDHFLAAAETTGADVLQGSILFGHGTARADGHADIRRPSGPVAMLQGAGNLLIRRPVLESMEAPWFDPAFALSGGEDRDFFLRLAARGTRFAWADDAIAHGMVPQTRARLRWLLVRAYSVGNSDMRVLMKHHPGLPLIARELVKIGAALLLSPPAAAIVALSANRRAVPLQRLCRAAGKLAAIFGIQYNEYSVVHGE